jgi:hypothetical protein
MESHAKGGHDCQNREANGDHEKSPLLIELARLKQFPQVHTHGH